MPELNASQLLDNGCKELWRRCEIAKIVALGFELFIKVAEPSADRGIGRGISKIPALIMKALLKPVPGFRAAVFGGQERSDLVAELFLAERVNGDSQDREVFWEQRRFNKIKEGWDELSFGEISGCAKDRHRARPRGLPEGC